MKKNKGKSKGSAFEREISKYLTFWLTDQNKEYYFWRSPGSGAVATVSLGNKSISGDIISLKPEAAWFTDKFNIELKTGYPKFSFDKILKQKKNDFLQSFWTQSIRDADGDKLPILIYKKKNINTWICINTVLYLKLKKHISEVKYMFINWDIDNIYIFDMIEFFNIITPKILKKIKV